MGSTGKAARADRLMTDGIFVTQMCLALLLGGGQFVKMLTSTQGVSASMFLFTDVFFCLLFWMAIIANKKFPGRMARQTIIVYATGALAYSLLLIETGIKAPVFWEMSDWVTTGLVFTGIVAIAIVKSVKEWTLTEPYLKTGLGLALKSIPQLLLAYKILQVGGGGVSGLWILSFHVFTISRLVPLVLLNRQSGWDRTRKSMLVSEIGNEGSWLAVTLAWLYRSAV